MNNTICIIGTANIKHISLISLYTRYFDEKGMSYDIIYLDRYGLDEPTTARNTYRYRYSAATPTGRLQRIQMFWRFRRFALKRLREGDYKYIITWQTTAAYLFADKLLRKYAYRYVINVRDYVAEKRWPFRWLIKQLVKKARFTALSSLGFKTFLPNCDYLLVNSINENLLQGVTPQPHKKNCKIRIGFAGNCRYFNESFKLIDALGNNRMFELWYCGTNSRTLKEYAVLHGYDNVKTISGFKPEETIEIMSSFDMVNSAFGNDAMDNSTLMPIRLYTAIALHRPMLVNEKTQLGREVEVNGLGFVIDNYDELASRLWEYYQKMDFECFDAACDRYLKKARCENQTFYKQLDNLLV